jgi:hypothetical protein
MSDIATITRCFGQFEVVAQALNKPAEAKSNRAAKPPTPSPKPSKPLPAKFLLRTSLATAASPLSGPCACRGSSAMNASPACALSQAT